MKKKIIASLVCLLFVIASCRKKQCPAYGSVIKTTPNEVRAV